MLDIWVPALLAVWEQQHVVQRLVETTSEGDEVGAAAASVDHHRVCGGSSSVSSCCVSHNHRKLVGCGQNVWLAVHWPLQH